MQEQTPAKQEQASQEQTPVQQEQQTAQEQTPAKQEGSSEQTLAQDASGSQTTTTDNQIVTGTEGEVL